MYWFSIIQALFSILIIGETYGLVFAYDSFCDEFEKNPGLIMNLKKTSSGIKSTEQRSQLSSLRVYFIEEGKKTKAYIDGYLSRPENSTKCVLIE